MVTVLVLGTVLVAALLYVLVSGLTTGPALDDTMGLAAGSWSSGAIEIQVLSGPSDVAGVADPTYLVYDAQGVLYFNGHTGETQAVGGTSVTVTQRDANTNGVLDAGDSIEVKVSPASDADGFLGGTLFITGSGGETYGSIHV